MKTLKTLFTWILLSVMLPAYSGNYVRHSSPEKQVDVYITFPSAAYDSLMLKSARYHCAIDGFKLEYDRLFERIQNTPDFQQHQAEFERISDEITARKDRVREQYKVEMEPYLACVEAGAKVAFRNNGGSIEVTDVSIRKIEDYRVPHSKWRGYRLWLDVKAVNKIPMAQSYSDDRCGSDHFFLQWNVMVCDSRGREITMEHIIYTDDDFWGKMYRQLPGNTPRWKIIHMFDADTAFEDLLCTRISEIYDPFYDCPIRAEFTQDEKNGDPGPPSAPRKPDPPVPPRKPGTSAAPALPQKPAVTTPPVAKPDPVPEPEPEPEPEPGTDKPAVDKQIPMKPAAQQHFAIRQLGSHYSEGLLPARADNGKWGYLNIDGQWAVIPQFSKGNNAYLDFSDGVAIADGTTGFTLIYPDGKSLALPRTIQAVSPFCNGYAMVRMKGEGWSSKFGFIDRQGKSVFPHLAATGDGGDIYPLGKLSEGVMRYYDAKLRKFGYLDAQGNVVLAAQWEDAGDFSEGLAVAYGSDWGYIDHKGNWAIQPQWDFQDRPSDFHDGYAAVYKHFIDKTGAKVRELSSPYPFVDGSGYSTNTDAERLEKLSGAFSVVKSLAGRWSPGKIDGVYQMAFPAGYCTLQRTSRPGAFEQMQAQLVVDPDLTVVLDIGKIPYLKSVGNFFDGRATAFSTQTSDWDSDPDCVVDITGKIIFQIQK